MRDRARTRAATIGPLRVFCARCARLWTCHVDGLTRVKRYFSTRGDYFLYIYI